MAMREIDIKNMLKRMVELVRPDLRHYYRLPRKGRVVKSYASDGQYWADVQPLRNDESDDANEPVISRVEIPVIWGGPERGVVCPPTVGTLCDITYYDGDPNYPRISDFRWQKNKAPACALGELIIQQSPGIHIRITAAGDIEAVTSGAIRIQAATTLTLQAPQINMIGNVTTTGSGGGAGNFQITGAMQLTGSISATGSITDGGGNTNHHSH